MSHRNSSHRPTMKIHRIGTGSGGRHWYNVRIPTRPVRRELRAGLRTGGAVT